MAAQRLEKWLKTAANQAPQGWTVNFDFADAGRAHYLISRGVATKLISTRCAGRSSVIPRSVGSGWSAEIDGPNPRCIIAFIPTVMHGSVGCPRDQLNHRNS